MMTQFLPLIPVVAGVLGRRDDVLTGSLVVPGRGIVVVPEPVPVCAAYIIGLLTVLQRLSCVVPDVVTRSPALRGRGCNGDDIVVLGAHHRPVRTAGPVGVAREPVQEGRTPAHFDALLVEACVGNPGP